MFLREQFLAPSKLPINDLSEAHLATSLIASPARVMTIARKFVTSRGPDGIGRRFDFELPGETQPRTQKKCLAKSWHQKAPDQSTTIPDLQRTESSAAAISNRVTQGAVLAITERAPRDQLALK